jgi:UDP-N-acetylglucosamine--N-acetylmuramyl-(pentapeptide) pyrophosphoryl-undecaprenol N-acetylglucosamine transferase
MSPELLGATAAAGRERFGLDAESPVVLIYGGSLGARSLNLAAADAFGAGELPFQLVHVSGKRDYAMVRSLLDERGADPEKYHLLDYTVDLPLAAAAADLVVGRSGASVLELAAQGRPAVLVPYPYATADHQLKNAEWMAAAGAADVVLDSELDGEVLGAKVRGLLADRGRLEAMAAASAGLGRRDGAEVLADEVLRLARQ